MARYLYYFDENGCTMAWPRDRLTSESDYEAWRFPFCHVRNQIQVGVGIKFKSVRWKIEREVYDQFGRFTRPV